MLLLRLSEYYVYLKWLELCLFEMVFLRPFESYVY